MTKEELENKVAELETVITEKDAVIIKLEAEVKGMKDSGAKDRTVKGSANVKGKKYGFKTGYVKTRDLTGKLIDSTEALKDAKLMAHLVDLGYEGVEEVKK